MVTRPPPEDKHITVRFGGGLNTRASPNFVSQFECTDGKNFELEPGGTRFAPRKPLDLVATAPNGGAIKGGGQFEDATGTLKTFIQAAGNVYEWDGSTGFTLLGTVNAASQLRGFAPFPLSDWVIVTDLNQADVVKKWDGTTFGDLAHNLGGQFYARYASVDNERVFYGNVKSGAATPHMVVGSKRGDSENLTVANRASSSLAEDDPFFLLTLDFKPINGLVAAFRKLNISTEKGRMFQLTGSSAKDYSLEELYPGSQAAGDEAVVFAGNDVVYGRQGAIESLMSTEKFGDVETDDLSLKIFDEVRDVTDWALAYSPLHQKVYCFDFDNSRVFVLHKGLVGSELSPWSVWETDNGFSFKHQSVLPMRRPSDGVQTVYVGGATGEIYELEGSGSGDGGITDIVSERLSPLYSLEGGMTAGGMTGEVLYEKPAAADLDLIFETEGNSRANETVTVSITRTAAESFYANGQYYSGSAYYGAPNTSRLGRHPISVALPGDTTHFRVRAKVTGTTDFKIHEVNLRYVSA